MHPGQHWLTVPVVAGLVAAQFPQWAGLPVVPVDSAGTVNALFRIGPDLVCRFPLQGSDPGRTLTDLIAERQAARLLSDAVSAQVPEFVAMGSPGIGYPLPWSVYRWLPGRTAVNVKPTIELAADLARTVREIRSIDIGARRFAGSGRGGRLADHDDWVHQCLAVSGDLIDVPALQRLWHGLRVREPGPVRMTHGDLMPGNLLIDAGRLTAVLDVATAQPADPAVDLAPAWNLLDGAARDRFREQLQVDEPEWERGRGWALVQAIGALEYYHRSNPVMSRLAHRTLRALLATTASMMTHSSSAPLDHDDGGRSYGDRCRARPAQARGVVPRAGSHGR